MDGVDNNVQLSIKIRDESDFAALMIELEATPCPPGLAIIVEDDSALGAFDTEWAINLALSFSTGIAGNLVASWLWDRFHVAVKPVIIVGPDGEQIDAASEAGKAKLEQLLSRRNSETPI